MDTTYYTFQTRKIKASGGADLVTLVPSLQPAPTPGEENAHAGEVLNFDLCRRRLETRAAWKGLAAAAQAAGEVELTEEPIETPEPAPCRPARRNKAKVRAPWMELVASALALGLVCLVGAVALLNIV